MLTTIPSIPAAQYEGLQKLQAKYRDQGFSVIAFPCNQFGGQEPEVCPRIKQFAQDKFHADFPMMDKVDVNGEHQSPVWATIQSAIPGNVKWNFEKVRLVVTTIFLAEICSRWLYWPGKAIRNTPTVF
jgi:glutathione peroxidase-family protein